MTPLYAVNTALIAAMLFVTMLLFMEGGYRLGWKRQVLSSDPIKSQFTAIQGSLLGLISLLLGDDRITTTGLYIQSLNDLIDSEQEMKFLTGMFRKPLFSVDNDHSCRWCSWLHLGCSRSSAHYGSHRFYGHCRYFSRHDYGPGSATTWVYSS